MPRPTPLSLAERWPAQERDVHARLITLASGLRLRVVESGPSVGPPVVLLHGWGGSAHQFARNIRSLTSRGLRVYAMDLPGHGLSEKPLDPGYYSAESLLHVLGELFDALAIDAAALVGQSLGGLLALRFALGRPGRVTRLALLSAIGLVEPLVVGRYGRLIPATLSAVMPRLARRSVYSVVMRLAYGEPERPTSRDVNEAWAATAESAYPRALLHLIRGMRWTIPAPQELGALRIPLLVIAGERDRIASPRRIGSVLDAVAGARLVVVPMGGHAVNEGNSAVVNDLLGEFLTAGVA